MMKLFLEISIALLVWKASLMHGAVLQRIGNSNDFFLIEQVKINDSKIEGKPGKPNETIFVEIDLRRKSARQDEDGGAAESASGAFGSMEGFLLSTLTGSIFAELVPGNVGNTIKKIYAPINSFVEPFFKNFMKNVSGANQANVTSTATTAKAEEEEREERAVKVSSLPHTHHVH